MWSPTLSGVTGKGAVELLMGAVATCGHEGKVKVGLTCAADSFYGKEGEAALCEL